MWVFLVGGAAAEDGVVGIRELVAWEREVAPQIEHVAGRSFAELPALQMIERGRAPDCPTTTNGEPPRFLKRFQADLALYCPTTQEIRLPQSAWKAMFTVGHLDPADLAPAVRCTLVHELTHALEHQHGGLRAEAASEGFAQHITRQTCGADLAAYERVSGDLALASLDPADPLVHSYTYGERFIRAVQAEAGIEGVWNLLVNGAADDALITRVGGAGLASGWREPGRLAVVDPLLGATSDWRTESASAPARGLQAWGATPRASAEGALVHEASIGEKGLIAAAWLLPTEEDARSWLWLRRADLDSATPVVLLEGPRSVHDWWSGGFIPFELRGRRTAYYWAKVGGDWRYLEGWVQDGRRLFAAAIHTPRPHVRDLRRALTALMELDLEEAPRPLEEADRAALHAFAPAAPLPTEPVDRYWFSRMNAAIAAEDWPRCGDSVRRLLPLVEPAQRRYFAAVGVGCAARAGDLPVAATFAAEADYRPVPTARLLYAERLAAAGHVDEALRLLAGPPTGDPKADAAAANLAARLRESRR